MPGMHAKMEEEEMKKIRGKIHGAAREVEDEHAQNMFAQEYLGGGSWSLGYFTLQGISGQ